MSPEDPRREPPPRIVACGVFRTALEHLGIEERADNLRLTFLPPHLHLRPDELKRRIAEEFRASGARGEKILCLFGECCPGLPELCRDHGAEKVPGLHCYEILLGAERCRDILEENAGTYFLLRELIVDFDRLCLRPLELDDPSMRNCFFEHYRKLLYVRQPGDPDLEPRARELARFLELELDVADADYSHLESSLKGYLRRGKAAED